MRDLALTEKDIQVAKEKVVEKAQSVLKTDLVKVILYGSCARGDYHADSDIDVALLTKCNRDDAKKYNNALGDIATDFAMEYYQVVNFVCFPYEEFEEKKAGIHILEILSRKGACYMDKEYYQKSSVDCLYIRSREGTPKLRCDLSTPLFCI